MNRYPKAVLRVLGATVLTSILCCTGSRKFEVKMVTAIAKNCQDPEHCALRLRDVTNFEWDRMFAFGYGAREYEIERILGTKYRWGGEFQRKIVFMKGKEIVFHEEEPTDIERPLKDEVVFDFAQNSNYGVYSHDVTFKVSKKWSENGIFYELAETH
jgi:hypothetical protein